MKLKGSRNAFIILIALVARSASATELDLAGYLRLVEGNNRDLAIARNEVDQMEAKKREALAGLLPSAGLQAGYTKNLNEIKQSMASYVDVSGGTPGIYPVTYTEVVTSFKNELDLAGGVNFSIYDEAARTRYRQAQAGLEAQKMGYDYRRVALLNAAKKLYYQTLLAGEVVKVRESSEKIAREAYDDAEAKYKAGLTTDLDALMAEVAWKSKAPETAESKKNWNTALLNLKQLAAMPSDEELSLTESPEVYPERPAAISLEEALAGRLDYALGLQQQKLDRLGLDAAKASYLPTLSGSLSVANQRYGDDASFDGYRMTAVQLGLKVALPVYTGGYRAAKLKEEKLGLAIGDIRLAQKEEAIDTELKSIELRLDEAKQRIDSNKGVVASAQRAYERASGAFRSGVATQIQLSQATLGLEGSRLQYLSAIYDYLVAFFDWEMAAGR